VIAYLVRRLLLAALTVVIMSFLVFGSIRIVPGKAVDLLLANTGAATPAERQDLEQKLGLSGPIWQQYGTWVGNLARGDLGKSVFSDQPIGPQVKRYLPVTLELGLMSMAMSTILGLALGVFAAVKHGSFWDFSSTSVGVAMLSIPGYWIATLIIGYGAVYFGWTPPLIYVPFRDDPLANLGQFWLPALLMSFSTAGVLMRLTRTTMLEVLRQDYIRTARAKGLGSFVVTWRHALRNAIVPVITMIGIYLGFVLGSTVIFEQIFALPGIGRYMIQSINSRDYPAVQAVAIVVATFVVIINLVVDIAYGVIDPRIRYGSS